MRPLFRSLFILAIFGVLAAHVSTGALTGLLEDSYPGVLIALDRWLRILLVDPFGAEIAAYALLGAGVFGALWAFLSGLDAQRRGRPERFQTW